MKKDNKSLKAIYDNAYKDNKKYSGDKNSFFTFSTDDVTEYVIENTNFVSMKVLEVGCGTGSTAYAISQCGASNVTAIDYSEEAIKTCRKSYNADNLEYKCLGIDEVKESYDVIVLQEVIEHLDEPEVAILSLMEKLNENGSLIITCPNFTNLRGYIWMTLQLLFDVPMSLSDLHYFSPFDFEEIAKRNKFELEWTTFAHDRVYGENLLVDMEKRLTNALRDAELPNDKVDNLIDWLRKGMKTEKYFTPINGGKGFYVFKVGC